MRSATSPCASMWVTAGAPGFPPFAGRPPGKLATITIASVMAAAILIVDPKPGQPREPTARDRRRRCWRRRRFRTHCFQQREQAALGVLVVAGLVEHRVERGELAQGVFSEGERRRPAPQERGVAIRSLLPSGSSRSTSRPARPSSSTGIPNSAQTTSMSLTFRWIRVFGRASPLCSER
jgi:hypothetical protein